MKEVSNYTEKQFKQIEKRIKTKSEKPNIILTFNPISFTGAWILNIFTNELS